MGSIPFHLVRVFVFIVGLVLGSFANVLIWRVPRGESIITPRSRCPACGHRLSWWENIPLLSYIILLGKCKECKATISLRYPLVELCMGILSIACLLRVRTWVPDDSHTLGILSLWALITAFCLLLVVITFVDLEHWRIPLPFTVSGMVLGIVTSIAAPSLTKVSLFDALLGLVLGFLPLAVAIEVYYRITHREGMGYGDCFLLGMVGANLGYSSLLFVLFASSLQGIAFVLPSALLGKRFTPPWQEEGAPQSNKLRHTPLPFGPFISLSALEWLFFRESLTSLFAPWLG